MNMSFLTIPPDVLASVLNRTDPQSLCNVLRSSKAVCEWVRSFKDLIRFPQFDEVKRFVDALPVIESENPTNESNVHLFASGAAKSVDHTVIGRARFSFGLDGSQYVSITCPSAIERLQVLLGGCQVLLFDRRLLQLFASDRFDIMAFLRYLPAVEDHWIEIRLRTVPDTPATLSVTVAPHAPQIGSFDCLVRWRFVEVVDWGPEDCHHMTTIRWRLSPRSVSLGFIIAVRGGAGLTTALVNTFTFGIDGSEHVVDGASTAIDTSIPQHLKNFPVSLHDCHYIPTAEKVDWSSVDTMRLQVDFWRPFVGDITFWEVRNNHLMTQGTMYVKRFD